MLALRPIFGDSLIGSTSKMMGVPELGSTLASRNGSFSGESIARFLLSSMADNFFVPTGVRRGPVLVFELGSLSRPLGDPERANTLFMSNFVTPLDPPAGVPVPDPTLDPSFRPKRYNAGVFPADAGEGPLC